MRRALSVRLSVVAGAACLAGACATEPERDTFAGPSAPTTPVTSSALPPSESTIPAPTAANPTIAQPTDPQGAPAVDGPRIAAGAQPAGLSGPWRLISNGQVCKIVIQEPPNSRAGWVQASPDCVDGFARAASWTLQGTYLFLYDQDAKPLGRLATAGPARFEGSAARGAPISLER